MPQADKHPVPIRDLLQTVDAGRTLDVASGVGQFTRLLVDCLGSYEEIVGIDTRAEAIEQAKGALTEPNVRFEVADATALPFPDNSFDTASLSNSLHHMADLEAVLSEIRRVVTPEGQLILFEMHSDAPNTASQNAIDLHLWAAEVDRALGKHHDPMLSRQQLLSLIDALALTNQRFVDWHSTDQTQDFEGVAQAIGQVLQQAKDTDEQEALAAKAEVLKERIRSVGIQSQPFVLAVGSFPLEA